MPHQFSDNLWNILVCPYCGQVLEKANIGAVCQYCHTDYAYTDSGALDLRLRKPKTYHLEFLLETPLLTEPEVDFKPLPENASPEVDFSGVRVPYHLTKELLSYFPRARGQNSPMLDLGCGKMRHREVCEYAGFDYVGLDYDSPHAPLLGDAHSLPFRDNSFEFILSIAMLEHIRFPFVMMREAHRVLKPHSRFIGTVAFLEPFHSSSFYHHTHLGIFNSLQYGGFQVEHIAPSKAWTALLAQARMGLFPKMPSSLCKALLFPLQALHKLWWRVGSLVDGRSTERDRILRTTAAFAFIAAKD